MTPKEKMQSGELYLPTDENIMKEQLDCLKKLYDYNLTRPHDSARREELLREMFAEIGEGCYIEPPLHANWAGRHVHFGKGVYANFNLTLVDDAHIYVGDGTMFAPNVVVATAAHPIDPTLRAGAYQYNLEVHIGKNCWIGAGAVILPGVKGFSHPMFVNWGRKVYANYPEKVMAYIDKERPAVLASTPFFHLSYVKAGEFQYMGTVYSLYLTRE